jgi:hypothetical protein
LAGTRNICETVAMVVVDPDDPASVPPSVKRWSAADPDGAIADFVTTLLALAPSDPRAAPASALLKTHFSTALQQPDASASDALRSTFAVACQAPSMISVGL